MDLSHASNGFIFLAVATGVATFFSIITTCIAVSDNEDYAGFMVVVTIILALAFLTTGFLGFATR
jgi:hypothetical protein